MASVLRTRQRPPLRAACRLFFPGLLMAALLAAPPARGADPAQPARELIAVLDLQAVGATEVEAAALTERLRETLLKTRRFTLVDRSQLTAVLNEQALQQTGCTSQDCAVQVGRILGVRKVVSGRALRLGERQWVLSTLLVDVETAETLRVESVRFQGSFFDLMQNGITDLARKLAGLPSAPDARSELAKKNQMEGSAFLAANGKRPSITTTSSGLQYEVLRRGTGKSPTSSSIVTAHYRGWLIDGTEFDNSYSRGQAAQLPVNGVIPGWSEVLQLMKMGARWKIWIPPGLAYGAEGAGPRIGPNVTLVFEIELIGVE